MNFDANIIKKIFAGTMLLLLLFFVLPQIAIFVFIIILILIINNRKMFDFNQFTKPGGQDRENVINVNPSSIARKAKNYSWIIAGIVVLAVLLPLSVVVVEAGEVGVYSLFGKVKDKELSSGFHFKNPLAKVNKMTIRTEEYTMSSVEREGQRIGVDSISALSKEGLSIDLEMTVLYRLQEDKASQVYRTVGLNYQEKIIRPAIRSTIREVVAQYDAKVIYSEKRREAAEIIAERLEGQLGARGIVLEDLLLRNVELPSELRRSIEEKLQAEQEAQKMEFVLDKEKKEKERKIIEAEGQRDAQQIINESLSDKYLNYLYVKNLENRDGTIYVPTDPASGLPMFKGIGQ